MILLLILSFLLQIQTFPEKSGNQTVIGIVMSVGGMLLVVFAGYWWNTTNSKIKDLQKENIELKDEIKRVEAKATADVTELKLQKEILNTALRELIYGVKDKLGKDMEDIKIAFERIKIKILEG